MPKFNRKENELTSVIDQWVYFIKNVENLNVVPENINDTGLLSAYADADKHNWTQAELLAYDKIFMRERDERGRMKYVIRKEREAIAKNLIKLGLSLDDISMTTGLTVEQIQKLIVK